MEPCCGCDGLFVARHGPMHAYMHSSPACWARYGVVLEREYADPALFAQSHRLTVDAYALQHPGRIDERRAAQSVWVHFLSLHAIFARGMDHDAARRLLQHFAHHTLPDRPSAPVFAITLADLSFDDHSADAARWARSAYDAWIPMLAIEADKLLG